MCATACGIAQLIRDVVICEPVRTPVGRFLGALRDVPAGELGAVVVRGVAERTGISTTGVDDVYFGHCYPSSDAPAIGRVVALNAGLNIATAGVQVDRRCGSGL